MMFLYTWENGKLAALIESDIQNFRDRRRIFSSRPFSMHDILVPTGNGDSSAENDEKRRDSRVCDSRILRTGYTRFHSRSRRSFLLF